MAAVSVWLRDNTAAFWRLSPMTVQLMFAHILHAIDLCKRSTSISTDSGEASKYSPIGGDDAVILNGDDISPSPGVCRSCRTNYFPSTVVRTSVELGTSSSSTGSTATPATTGATRASRSITGPPGSAKICPRSASGPWVTRMLRSNRPGFPGFSHASFRLLGLRHADVGSGQQCHTPFRNPRTG